MSQNQSIRVLLVDDHPVVRNGISLFLETCDDIICVGEADSGRKGVRMAAELLPDVVLMDIVMPDISGARRIPTSRLLRSPASRTKTRFPP
jgi:NarL family two-component system response regulator LiaR